MINSINVVIIFLQAVNAGSMGADCEASYPNKNCVLGKLGVSHNEL